ncbi:hypothetical protein AVEN_271029-1, partial [Araneus ventricosus]
MKAEPHTTRVPTRTRRSATIGEQHHLEWTNHNSTISDLILLSTSITRVNVEQVDEKIVEPEMGASQSISEGVKVKMA